VRMPGVTCHLAQIYHHTTKMCTSPDILELYWSDCRTNRTDIGFRQFCVWGGATYSHVQLPTANYCSKLFCRPEETFELCEGRYEACNRDGTCF
jgi:hypothetical protein